MVSKVFPADELADRTLEFARRIAAAADHDGAADQGVGQPDRRQHGLLQRAQRLLHPAPAQPLALGRRSTTTATPSPKEDGIPNWKRPRRSSPPARTRCAPTSSRPTYPRRHMAPPRRVATAVPTSGRVGRGGARRAPFSDNPRVGARGQRTQQRILEAALRVFGERGLPPSAASPASRSWPAARGCPSTSTSPARKTCSATWPVRSPRQLSASTEALGPRDARRGRLAVDPGVGRPLCRHLRALRAGLRRLPAAAESDAAVAGGSARTAERHVAGVRSRLTGTSLPPRQLDPLVIAAVGVPASHLRQRPHLARGRARRLPAGAGRGRPRRRRAPLVVRPARRSTCTHLPTDARRQSSSARPCGRPSERDGDARNLTAGRRRTLQALMHAGRDLFVARGYHDTHINDVAAAAGCPRAPSTATSRARTVSPRSSRWRPSAPCQPRWRTSRPDGAGRTADLRRWLRQYNATQAGEAAMIRVWGDAARHDPTFRADSAAALDWGRRRMAHFLQPRGFGDVDSEAVVTLALLSAFGVRQRPSRQSTPPPTSSSAGSSASRALQGGSAGGRGFERTDHAVLHERGDQRTVSCGTRWPRRRTGRGPHRGCGARAAANPRPQHGSWNVSVWLITPVDTVTCACACPTPA